MTQMDRDIESIIDAIRRAAASEIMPRFRSLSDDEVLRKSGPNDLVTAADLATEARIAEAVGKIWPEAAIIGEEAVAASPDILDEAIGSERRCVLIDPVDGTGNYVAGIAVFGVILAVVERGETLFGLLYDPVMDDWMSARRGQGAWYAKEGQSSRRLATRPPCPLEEASGFLSLYGYDGETRAARMRALSPALQVRDLRCSCHEYRLLASGQADFLASSSLNSWDHAAGVLLVQEAGGWVGVESHGVYAPSLRSGTLVAASCPEIGAQVTDRLSTC